MDENEFEKNIREQIYKALHTPVVSRLRGLGFWATTVVNNPESTPANIRYTLARMDDDLREVIRRIRLIVSPPSQSGYQETVSEELRRDRFISHLESDIQSIQRDFGLYIDFHCLPQQIQWLTPVQLIAIQDILGNWLNNVGLYAQAQNAFIELYAQDDRRPSPFNLKITDDGVGNDKLNDLEVFCLELPLEHKGLRIIREAAQRLNANLQINSHPLNGTTLTVVKIPIIKNKDELQ